MIKHRFLSLSVFALAALAGCNTLPPNNALLDEARNEFRSASEDQPTRDLAGGQLQLAREALTKANDAWTRKDEPATVNHLAYLAKQRTAVARETARLKSAEQEVSQADMARDKVRLAARTEEVVDAKRDAAVSEQRFEASRQQAANVQALNTDLQAQLKVLNAKPTTRGMVVTIGDMLFDTNQASLKPGGRRHIEQLAQFLKQFPQRKALVEGFTDSVGGDDANQALSSRRADAVRSALMGMGVTGDRISTQGFGESYPVAENASAAGRQMNRRVEVLLADDTGAIAPR